MSHHADVTTRTGRPRQEALRLALIAGCASLLMVGGCGRDGDQQAISDASIKLSALDVGVGTRVPPGVSTKTYNEVIQSMQPLASGEGANAADAAVLLANAQRGLGIHRAAEAANLEKLATNMLPGIRARLRAWQMHNAAAKAAAAYDPAPELARLDSDVQARQAQAERERARKAEIEAKEAELLNQVADRLARASSLRDQAGSLELQIPAVSATEGLELTKQIRELSRQADALELDARDLKNQADRLALDVQGADVEIQKLTEQIRLIGESRAAVQARAKAAQEEAARARGDAQQAAVEIAERVDTAENALTPFREQQVAPATEKAVEQFRTAAASAKRGVGARRSNAQLAAGQAQQSLGDACWTSALGHGAYALLMEELAAAEPALPAAAEYASRAQAARTAANEARQSAYDAYQQAKGAYEATGASGEAKALLEQVSVRLNEISRAVGKGVVSDDALGALVDPEPGADEGEPEQTAPADEVAAADPAEEIRELVRGATEAAEAGRYSAFTDIMHPASDDEARAVELMGDTLLALESLERATSDAFGESFLSWLAANPPPGQAGQVMNPADSFSFDADALDIQVQDDEAVAYTGDAANPQLDFRRVDGRWKMLFSYDKLGAGGLPENLRAVMAEMMPTILSATSAAYAETASQVESGALESNQAVLVAISTKLQPLNMQIMQKVMEAGGGGG